MSCDNNGKHAVRTMLSSGGPTTERIIDAFGGSTDDAFDGLMRIVETARAQASQEHMLAQKDPKKELYWDAQQNMATQRMALLFNQWKQDMGEGFQEPAHGQASPTLGVRIPRDKTAHHGWAALQQTLGYFSGTEPRLPSVAQQIIEGTKHRRFESLARDKHGMTRCRNCGRFASFDKSHLCPQTAGPEEMAKALQRKLKTPVGAYHPHHGFAAMMTEALETHAVKMTHPLTGETIEASLDGVLVAIQQGFVPRQWHDESALVTLDDGRVVPVLNAEGMTQYIPSSDVVTATAGAYGTAKLATRPPRRRTLLPFTPEASPVPTPLIARAMHTLPVDELDPSASTPSWDMEYDMSERYDRGRIVGNFFKKRGTRGRTVYIDGEEYTIGESSYDIEHQASARAAGLARETTHVTIGNTITDAGAILKNAYILRTSEGIELYDQDELIGWAKYEDMDGYHTYFTGDVVAKDETHISVNPRLTPVKTAAILALMGIDPQTPIQESLARDIEAMRNGDRHVLAVADAGYLALTEREQTVVTSNRRCTEKCLDCGQFMGSVHTCPAGHAHIKEEEPTPVVSAPPDAAAEEPTPVVSAPPDAAAEEPTPVVSAPPRFPAELQSYLTSMTHALDSIASKLNGATPPPQQGQEEIETKTKKRESLPIKPKVSSVKTAQEHIMKDVVLPQTMIDPYLTHIPSDIGGNLDSPLPIDVPVVDPNFAINASTERALRLISASLQTAWNPKNTEPRKDMRSFALYGPPGTGKNTTARQVAATLGLPYTEVTINSDTSAQEEIGTTVLRNGTTQAQLGRLGYAAAMGQVVCVNEIVRNPKLATAFQSMIEDGYIELQGTEGGKVKIPVHPNTIFVFTWNPGNEGDAERMAMAPLSRTMAIQIDSPTIDEQADRILAKIQQAQGTRSGTTPPHHTDIFKKRYHIHEVRADKMRVTAVARFMDGLQKLARNGQIAIGGENVVVGPREASRFYETLEATRDPQLALETLKIYCDQDPAMFESQWRAVNQLFNDIFGTAGTGLYGR